MCYNEEEMISFVWTPSSFWTPPFPLIPGNGGTEAFTLGQARELTRRGIPNQIVTFRLGKKDGREFSPDLNFVDFADPKDVVSLDGDAVFATEPLKISTKKPPFIMLHNPPYKQFTKQFYKDNFTGRRLMTNSRASARLWAEYLGAAPNSIGVVFPFADAAFAAEPEPKPAAGPTRVLFAGRLTVAKGFYTFLESLHSFDDDKDFIFTVVLAGTQGEEFRIIQKLVAAHPMLRAVPPRPAIAGMASLLVNQDIVVMPSHSVMWPEPFGMLSVEAQHAGCRVVASRVGGLPETDCGGLHTFEPDNPLALASAIRQAAKRGRLSVAERQLAAAQFTVAQSVDKLTELLNSDLPVYRAA